MIMHTSVNYTIDLIDLLTDEDATIAKFVKELGDVKNRRLYWTARLQASGVALHKGKDAHVTDEEIVRPKSRVYIQDVLPKVIEAIYGMDIHTISDYRLHLHGAKHK